MRHRVVSLFEAFSQALLRLLCHFPMTIFTVIFVVHFNMWATKLCYHFTLFLFHSLSFLRVSETHLIGLKKLVVQSRELKYVQLSEWATSAYRVWKLNDRVDVVVAHYKEDLGWLSGYLGKIDRLFLYCKDQASCTKGLSSDLQGAQLIIEYLPNEGREAHTYLYHILKYYGHFPRRTVFTMASLNGNYMRQLSFAYALTETDRGRRHYYKGKDDWTKN